LSIYYIQVNNGIIGLRALERIIQTAFTLHLFIPPWSNDVELWSGGCGAVLVVGVEMDWSVLAGRGKDGCWLLVLFGFPGQGEGC
jgi:hypothetical protein